MAADPVIRRHRSTWLRRNVGPLLEQQDLTIRELERIAEWTLGLLPNEEALAVVRRWCDETNTAFPMLKKRRGWREAAIKRKADGT